jgi:hypothetical protein
MKRLTCLLLIGIVPSLAGCGKLKVPLPPAAVPSKTVVARDGSCQVVLPPGWVERKKEGNPVLRAGVPSENALFMVMRIPKEDLAADETCLSQGRGYMDELRDSPAFEQLTITRGPIDCAVNGRAAVRYEVEVILKKGRTKFYFHIKVVDGEKSFFRLVGTLVPSEAAKHRGEVEEITNSFTELP